MSFRRRSVAKGAHDDAQAAAPKKTQTQPKLGAKAKKFRLLSLARPHMLSFHVTWFAFSMAFFAAVTPSSLTPVLRNTLTLSNTDLRTANIAALLGSVISRIIIGVLCDLYGPRYAHAGLLLCCAPAVFAMSTVQGATGFVITRLITGISLGSYTSTTYASVCMFSPFICGVATAVSAGWGNVGGGLAEFIAPALFSRLRSAAGATTALRLTFFLPGTLMLFSGILMLAFAQDYPAGAFWQVVPYRRKRFAMTESMALLSVALRNYRTWVLMLLYLICFGVDFAMFSVLPTYLRLQYQLRAETASTLTAVFGIMDVFARPLGGISSDWCGRQYGMRGRCWLIFCVIMVQGICCMVLGLLQGSSFVVAIIACVAFSIMVQAAEGAVVAVVTFTTYRAQGTCQGLVGSAGQLGAVVYLLTFFNDSLLSTSAGFVWTGIWTCAASLSTFTIAFPMWGSMLRRSTGQEVEEDYYELEWTEEEILAGDANAAMQFAAETISERGRRSLMALMDEKKSSDGSAIASHDGVLEAELASMNDGVPDQIDDVMQQRLALLDDDHVESTNWDDFISQHATQKRAA